MESFSGASARNSELVTALADIQHRAWVLRKSIWDYIEQFSVAMQSHPSAGGYTLDQQRLNSETDRQRENILLNGDQWYKAIKRRALPKEVRKSISSSIDTNLEMTVVCLRNLREHWEHTRRYFENHEIVVPPDQTNVLWFKATYPNGNPWSSGFVLGAGFNIGGFDVLNLHDLLIEADKVDAILRAHELIP